MPEPVPSPAGFPWLRRLLFAVLAAAAVTVGVAYVGPLVLPQTASRSVAQAVIGWGLGHPVIVAGEAEFSILPRLSVSARDVSAVPDESLDGPLLFDIPHLRAELDTLGVVLSRVHVRALSMERPVVRLSIDRAGRPSWRRAEAKPEPDAVRPDHDWGIWRELQIDLIRITDGRVVFEDRRSGQRVVAEKVGLSSSNPVNTEDGPGLLIGGGAVINGERFAMKFETGQASKFISGDRLPVVVDVVGAPLAFRFQGGAALRQFFVSEGTATLNVRDLGHLDRWLGGLFTAPVTGPLEATAHVSANGPRIGFDNINIRTGSGTTKGFLRLRRNAAGHRTVEAEFKADVIDLTPWLPAGRVSGTPSRLIAALYPESTGGSVGLEWRDLRYGSLSLGAGVAKIGLGQRQHFMDAELRFDRLYGGAGEARLRLGHAEGMTSLDFRLAARRVAARDFLGDAAGGAALAGTADMSVELLSVGSTAAEITAALSGKGTFNIVNGEILDANLAGHLSGADADGLPFAQLVGSFRVRQGVIRGDDLLLRAQRLSLVGAGAIDLAANRVDIDLRTLDTVAPTRDGIRPVKPFRIEGTLAAFEITAE